MLELDDGVVAEPSLVGEVAHMVAEEENGPRGCSPLTREERNAYPNLLLMCHDHHKFVDDHPDEYPVGRLLEMKQEHEEWVRANLDTFDAARQRDHEVYAMYIEHWARLASLDNWESWSSFVLGSGTPKIAAEVHEDLCELSRWLLGRVWSKRYSDLEQAFETFHIVLYDFLSVLGKHLERERDGLRWANEFYRIPYYDEERYHRLLQEFDFYVSLVCDLMVELTRAGNRLCDRIRSRIDPGFRLSEGVLMALRSDALTAYRIRAEYKDDTITYSGLDRFLIDRIGRVPHFGEGTGVDDPAWKAWVKERD